MHMSCQSRELNLVDEFIMVVVLHKYHQFALSIHLFKLFDEVFLAHKANTTSVDVVHCEKLEHLRKRTQTNFP